MADIPGIAETTLKVKEMSLGDNITNTQEKSESRVNENNKEIIFSSVTNSGDFNGFDVCTDFTFDNVIGHLEDMLIDEGFHALQNSFLENYWEEFSDNEENKHSYMIIFNEYTNKIEDFIVDYLKERIPNFDMNTFALELERRKDTLEGEIFEVLLTLSDFSAFKEIFLDYRARSDETQRPSTEDVFSYERERNVWGSSDKNLLANHKHHSAERSKNQNERRAYTRFK